MPGIFSCYKDLKKESQEVSNLENLVRISNKRHNDAKCKLEKREKILVGLLVDYKLEIKLLKTRIEFLENKKSEEQRLIKEEIQKTVKERENLPSTPLSRLTDDDTSKNNSDEEISDDEAAEEVTEEPDTAAKINLLIDLSTEDSLVADDLLNERNESIEESIENVSEKSGSNNQFSRQKTTIEVHLKVVYILIISLKMQWRTILCKV